jgi:predicted small metal-binding protein
LVECKDNKEICRTKINHFKKKHKNIVSVHETIPFKDPEKIKSSISHSSNVILGDADFIIEMIVDPTTNLNELMKQFKEDLPKKAKIAY